MDCWIVFLGEPQLHCTSPAVKQNAGVHQCNVHLHPVQSLSLVGLTLVSGVGPKDVNEWLATANMVEPERFQKNN